MVRQLFSAGHINIDIQNYGALKILKTGNDILFNSYKFKRREEILSGKLNITKNMNNFENFLNKDQIKYEQLRKLRLEFAKKLKLPAYVIFPDKTLLEMAKYKPKNLDDLEKIYGVGKAKLKKFGEDFINLINKNIEEK